MGGAEGLRGGGLLSLTKQIVLKEPQGMWGSLDPRLCAISWEPLPPLSRKALL